MSADVYSISRPLYAKDELTCRVQCKDLREREKGRKRERERERERERLASP